MSLAYPMQKLQDWITQQWVIFRGQKINPEDFPWLMGPFGVQDIIGRDYIELLAEKENLVIEDNASSKGLIQSMTMLNLSETELSNLSQEVIAFYEKTSDFNLNFSVKWNPFFKISGILISKLFSKRINQLNIPTNSIKETIHSKIITLVDPITRQIRHTIWFRSIPSTGRIIYSGIYGVCTLPSGETYIKAVFPLPNGNATVIMTPSVGKDGELILDSSGKKFGDAGFYFLLRDSKGEYWSQFIRSFRDRLIINSNKENIKAEQTLTLWHKMVLKFNYIIISKK